MTRRPWRTRPRLLGALVFAAAGLVVPAAWYGPVVVPSGKLSAWLLFLGIPTLSAAAAGALGAPALDPARCAGGGAAALRGAGLALAAFVLFSLLFGLGMNWSDPGGWRSVLGLAGFTLSVGLLVSWWHILPLGAAAGWLVWRLLHGPGRPAPRPGPTR